MSVLFFSIPFVAGALQFPTNPGVWRSVPVLDAFDPSRATLDSIYLSWSRGEHSLLGISHYEVQVRWPLVVEENDHKLQSRPLAEDYYAMNRVLGREWAKQWSVPQLVYEGTGRTYNFSVPQGLNGTVRVFDFQVRAVSVNGTESDWSPNVLMHVLVPNRVERFLVELVGTGRNNPGFSQIIVNGITLLNRTDLRGFGLAVFDRSDFSCVELDSFDVFSNASESFRMTQTILRYADVRLRYFFAIVSGYGWEWKTTVQLVKILEALGAFHVGQWASIFSNAIRPSEYADLSETASKDAFGHPYALFGAYGWGTGNGIESLQLNTGHYLTTGKVEKAIIRIQVYYNYMLGRYFVSSEKGFGSSDFFVRSQVPQVLTVHNPVNTVVNPEYQIQVQGRYAPYIGNLHNVVEYLMEANETVVWDEFGATNYGFEIVQVLAQVPDPLVSVDPRTNSSRLLTEIERLWGGPSLRTAPRTANGIIDRVCPNILSERELDHTTCVDYNLNSPSVLLQFGIGLFSTNCGQGNLDCTGSITGGSVTGGFITRADQYVGGPIDLDSWIE
jgi:hypothetical protein